MKFTSEDLMKAMGLQVGDRVKVYDRIYELKKTHNGYFFDVVDKEIHRLNLRCALTELLNEDYEILPRPKRVGELKCKDFECAKCHLRCLPHCNQFDNGKKTLFNTLNSWNEYDTFDQEIYDLLKARLDKVVE